MLHRIQTYYLIIVIIVQSIAAIGMEFFRFKTETQEFVITSMGITEFDENGAIVDSSIVPLFIGFVAMALLAFLCIRSYKDTERQFKLGRTIFYLYFVGVLTMYLMSIFGDAFIGLKDSKREVGMAYWLFIAGFPFSFLANTSIKRDKKILDSLKRL